VLLAKCAGASAGFLLGRTILHDWVKGKLQHNERFKNIHENVGANPFKFAILLRLSPVPSWLNTYGLSLTSIPFPPFFFATFIGSVPTIVQNVYMGSMVKTAALIGTGSEPTEGIQLWKNIMFVVGLLSTVVVSRMLVSYAAKSTEKERLSERCD